MRAAETPQLCFSSHQITLQTSSLDSSRPFQLNAAVCQIIPVYIKLQERCSLQLIITATVIS